MGSFSSLTSQILSVAKAMNSADDMAKSRMALDIKNKQLVDSAAIQTQKNLLEAQASETARIAKLQKAIASQRATFGARGIGVEGGSSEAVLDGLENSSRVEANQNAAKTALDNQAIADSLNAALQQNLLQKQQLRQKSNLALLQGVL